jgi:hypoxia up-regulated 1
MVQIESLYEDIDFRSRLSRTSLETAVDRILPLFSSPLTSALASADIPLSRISSVILFGGNTRVPFVHSAIRNVLGGADDKIAQNVNTDEAAVLGAAYYGAGLSRLFKMKNIEVTERAVGEITMGGEVVFGKGAKLGEKKSFLLPASQDLVLEFAQDR